MSNARQKTPFNPPMGGFLPDHPHKPPSAGARVGLSTSKLNKMRMSDSARIAAGEEPEGPIWAVNGKGYIFYIESDLVAYLRKNIRRVTESAPVRKQSCNPKAKRSLNSPSAA